MATGRGKRVVLLLGATGAVAFAVLITATRYERIWQRWWNRTYGVPVVKTWEELRALPPIELEDGVTVRLGIEATRVPAGRGVLVYCLSDSRVRALPAPPPSGDRLGPLRIRVKRRGAGHDQAAARHASPEIRRLPAPLLFSRAVLLEEPGFHSVSILRSDGAELRSVVIEATTERYHRWAPWSPSGKSVHHRAPRRAGYAVAVRNLPGPAVMPAWDGWFAVVSSEELVARQRRPRQGRLPPLVPDEPDPGLRLLALDSGKTLAVTADDKSALEIPFLERFLVRWWVDGEPWDPVGPPDAASPGSSRGFVGGSDTLHLLLDFDSTALGATRGDRIGVQLLHFSNGWMLADPDEDSLAHHDPGEAAGRMTNRVEFTVP